MACQTTFYTASITKAIKILNALGNILEKGKTSSNAASLPSARMHDDMLPLTMQVFIACAHARKLVGRLTGAELSVPENNLVSFDDMCARLAETQELLVSVNATAVEARADKVVDFPIAPNRAVQLSVATVTEDYHLPNMFFHVITAYNILRKEGVVLGKADFEDAFMATQLNDIQT